MLRRRGAFLAVDWVEDANGNRSDFTYDGHDRLIKLNFPSATVGAHAANSSDYEEYGYDPAGNMTSKRLRSGETISFTYDVLNRETVKDVPGGTSADVYSGYDLLGRKLFAKFVSTSGDGVVYTYDALARILSEPPTAVRSPSNTTWPRTARASPIRMRTTSRRPMTC